MANGYKHLSDKEQKELVAHYAKGNSMRHTANKFVVSVATVKKFVDQDKQNGQFANKVEQINQQNTNKILDLLEDDDTADIVKRYKKVIKDEANIKGAINGGFKLQFFSNTLGMLWDKAFKMEDLLLKRESMQLNNKIFETYNPGNDNFKKAMANQVKKLGEVNFDKFIEEESIKESDV